MREAVIVAAVRTPGGKANKGALRDTRPEDLMAIAIKGALSRVPALDPSQIDDMIVGCAMPEGEQGMNVARIAGAIAGLPYTVPAVTVNRFCSSGLQTIAQAAERIMAGAADVIIAGGVESMSMVPMGGNKPTPHPGLLAKQPEWYTPMGSTAEIVAQRFEVSREDQDAFAVASHTKALAAQAAGRFDDELVPVETVVYQHGGAKQVTLTADEGPREGTSMAGLAKLRPVFSLKGTVTAGNTSQMTDGAAAVIVMAREKAEELGITPIAVFRGYQIAGVPPEVMGIGPAEAIPKLLAKTGKTIDEIDLFEINEAFASQAVYCQRKLGIPDEKINVNGGAIALGHPLGCTGAKLTATLLHELKRRGGKYGIVSMCIGGGMGAAGLFEIL